MVAINGYRELIPIEKCARCGYSEMKCSLHVHHLDGDKDNNNIANLLVLCANCHYGLHHKYWNLLDIGISVIEYHDKRRESRAEFVTEYQRIKKENVLLLTENQELRQQVDLLKNIVNYHELSRKTKILSMAFIGYYNYNLRDLYVNFIDSITEREILEVDGEFGTNTRQLIRTKQRI